MNKVLCEMKTELSREIEKHFPKIEKLFIAKTLCEFLSTGKIDLYDYNFGLGTIIRLKMLSSKSVLYKQFEFPRKLFCANLVIAGLTRNLHPKETKRWG